MPPAPVWIRTPAELGGLTRKLGGVEAVAVDTEADSLHHYPERLCLIQLADPDGQVYLIDSLALSDLEPLRPLWADSATVKIFHSADNDLAHLKRRFGFTFASLADTMLAARFLGMRELGLERLLATYLGIHPAKSQQKTDWARRPLTPAQEEYAAEDVRHLIALLGRLVADLRAVGRAHWLAEECAALAAVEVAPRAADEDGYRRLRGASRLDGRGLSVLQALHTQRETWALAEHRPPFKVLSPETLVALATAMPRDPAGLAGVHGLSPRLIERYGAGILSAIARGLAAPIATLPRARRPGRSVASPVVRQRAETLRCWRRVAAERTGLDPGVLLPQRLIDVLAVTPPADEVALAAVPGFRHWRAEAFGAEILGMLAADKHR